jgi:hypothetical protein
MMKYVLSLSGHLQHEALTKRSGSNYIHISDEKCHLKTTKIIRIYVDASKFAMRNFLLKLFISFRKYVGEDKYSSCTGEELHCRKVRIERLILFG